MSKQKTEAEIEAEKVERDPFFWTAPTVFSALSSVATLVYTGRGAVQNLLTQYEYLHGYLEAEGFNAGRPDYSVLIYPIVLSIAVGVVTYFGAKFVAQRM